MRKIIKRYGNTYIIKLAKEDMEIYGLQEGDVVDISEITVVKRAKK